jgi:hypothetical protein
LFFTCRVLIRFFGFHNLDLKLGLLVFLFWFRKSCRLGCFCACYNAFATIISFTCQMWLNRLTLHFNETHDFDGEIQIFQQHMQKQMVQVLNPFFSFVISFQRTTSLNILVMMLKPHYKGLGVNHSIFQQGENIIDYWGIWPPNITSTPCFCKQVLKSKWCKCCSS